MPLIIPAILSDSVRVVQSQLDRVAVETDLRRVQIDIVDPDFADEITVSPVDLLELDFHGLSVDVHLMTNDPIADVIECSQVKGIHAVIAQIEHMVDQRAFLDHVHSYHLGVGLALDLTTPVSAIESQSWTNVDMVQVMGISAGAQGRPFGGERVYEKIRTLHTEHPTLELLVDGGISPSNVALVAEAGVTGVVVGSFLWKTKDLAEAVAALSIGN